MKNNFQKISSTSYEVKSPLDSNKENISAKFQLPLTGSIAMKKTSIHTLPSRLLIAALACAALLASHAPASANGGLSFTNYTTDNGLGNNNLYGVYASGSSIYAATEGGLSISTDASGPFTNYTTGNGLGNNYVFGVYASGSSIYAATFGGGLSISTNNGTTFTNRTTGNGLGSNQLRGVYASGSSIYAATRGGLSISTDGGGTFINSTTGNGLVSNLLNGVYASGSSIYAATDFGLSISTDGGATFTNYTTSNGLGANNVRGVYASGNSIYAATFGGGLSISTDGGLTFGNRTTLNGLGSNNLNGVYASGSSIYAATINGLSISTDGGATFTNYTMANGLVADDLKGVYASESSIYAATFGGLSIGAFPSTTLYWLGSAGDSWTAANNWSSNATGTPTGNFTASSDIVFSADNSSNETATNLGGDQTISSLTINTTAPVGISGGNLTVSGATAINTGTLTIGNGGTTGALIGDITNNATLAFNRSNNSTYSGTIDGTGNVNKLGNGTLTLNASNTYTGTTTLSAGTLALGNADALSVSTLDHSSNATLRFSLPGANTYNIGGLEGDSSSSSISIGNNTLSIGANNESTAFSGAVSGTGSIIKSGTGTLTLSGSSTYNGTTSLNAGTLQIGSASGLGSGGNITFGGGTLQYGTGITADVSSRIKNSGSTIAIDTGGNTVTYSSTINATNSGGLTKLGNGTLSLNGNNSYTGGTAIESGTLTGNNLGLKGNITNNATLLLTNGSSYQTEISGAGNLLVANSAALLGNATMSGGTTIQSGTLTIGGRNSAQTFILGSIDGDITNEGALRFDMNTGNRTYSGVISGNGSLVSTSSASSPNGILYLRGNNTFTGGTTFSHGTLDISGGTLASSGNLTILGGSFDIGASNQTIGNFKINGFQTTAARGSGILTASSYDLQQGTVSFSLNGTAGLAKNSVGYGSDSYQNGVVHLSGNNTATGNITVSSGILSFNTVQALYSGNNASWTPDKFSVSANSTLALGTGDGSATSGFSDAQIFEIFSSLTQNSTVTLTPTTGLTAGSSIGFNVASGNFTLNSTISDRLDLGVIGMDKIGAGALVLGSSNTFTGPINIYEGTIRAGTDYALSNSTSLVVSLKDNTRPATYDIGDFNQQFVNVTLLSGILTGGNGTITSTGNYSMVSGNSFANLAGVAPLLKTGSGIAYLYGNSTYLGHTTINGTYWSRPSASDARLQFQNPVALYTDDVSKWNGGNITVNQYGIFSVRADDTGAQGFTEDRIATLITNLISANRTSGGFLAGSAFGIDTAGTNMTLSTALTDSTGQVPGGGAIGFIKYGTGTLTLNGTNNTHSLVTSVTGGTLALAPGTTLSASNATISVQNAALDLGSTNQTVARVEVSSGSILGSGILTATAGGYYFTSANISTNLAGNVGASISYPGTTTLWGNNTHTGDTAVYSSAVLSLANLNAVVASTLVADSGSSTQFVVAGANTYNLGGLSGTANIAFGNNTLSIGANNQSTSYGSTTGSLSGTGSVVKVGNGTLTFAGNNNYSGGTTISGGTLALGSGGTAGSVTGDITNNAALVFNRSDNSTYSGIVSGNGSVTKNGSGLLTLSGNSTYSGNTTINTGTLGLDGTLASTAISIASGAGLNTSGGVSANAAVANSGNFTVNAADTIGSLSGSGNTILNAALTTGAVGQPHNPDQISGIISGIGAITFNSIPSANRASALTANNTYTGSTTVGNSTLILSGNGSIASSSALTLGANGRLSIGSVTANSSTFNNLSSLDSTATIELASNTLINIATDNRTFYGTIGSGNPGGFTKRGNGTLTLAGNMDYFGATSIEEGVLFVSGSLFGTYSSVAPTAVSVSSGATYQLGSNDTVGSIAGAGSIDLDSYALTLGVNTTTADTTFSGVVSGANGGSLIKAGTGTLTLTGNNTYSGTTTVKSGTLQVATGGSIAGGELYIGEDSGDNGTLNLTGGSINHSGINDFIGSTTSGTGIGTANVSAGTWVNDEFAIGQNGIGTINLSGTGNITSNGGAWLGGLTDGYSDTGSGTANVSGGSWTVGGLGLSVGLSGTGILNLSGGNVTHTGASGAGNYVGWYAGALGTANVSGGTWSTNEELSLGGDGGTGILNLSGTGLVTNTEGYLAGSAYPAVSGVLGVGVANISGGSWINSGNLTVGLVGNGTLNLTENGTVTVGGLLTLASDAGSTGTLNLGNGTTAGTLSAATITGGNGAALVNINQNASYTLGSNMTGSLSLNHIGTGTTTLTGNSTYTGSTTVNAGTLAGTTSSLQGYITNNAVVNFDQGNDGTYAGAMSGTGTLVKTGAGTLILTGSNTYAGVTAVNGGLLEVNTSLQNTATEVNSGGTLAGNGTLGDVVINSGGTIAPGNSPGNITVGNITVGNMTWNSGGTYAWELGNATSSAGTGWDLIDSSGNLTINANSGNKFTIAASTTNASGFNPNVNSYSWKIADFAGGISGFSADAFSINATGFENLPAIYGFGVSKNGTAINFNYVTLATWIGGTGNWTNTSNWENGAPPVNGVMVDYAGSDGTSTNDSTVGNINSLVFTNNATGSFTLTGGNLTIGEGGIANNSNSTQTVAISLNLGADQTFAANTANLAVSGNITGAYSLTKEGNQTLTFAGANTYTGETNIDAGTLAIAAGGSLTGTSKIFVGNTTSSNNLSILGAVSTADLTLSHQVGSDDNTVIVGGGSSPAALTVANLLNVGFGGTGNTLDILGNGTVTAGSTEIGGYGANNSLNLTGGVLNSTGYLVVGYFADDNALNITAGGNATVGSVTVGLDGTSANNTILVSGTGSALHTAGLIYLGENGTSNTLSIENGGKVVSQNADAVIGFNAGSNGNALTINGTGSQFTNNGTLYVGKGGSENTLSVIGGGSLVSKNSRIGHDATSSNNTATVFGNGSTWANAGTLRVGSAGSGNTLAVTSGANVTVTGNTFIGHGAASANNLISVEGAGSTFKGGNLTVGLDGSSNILTVSNGGNVSLAGALAIGYNAASSNNTATVSGAGSVLSAQNIQIGSGADNKLIVADSGLVSTANITLAGTDATLQIGEGGAAGNLSLTGSILTSGTVTGRSVVFNHSDSAYQFASAMSGDLAVSQIGNGTTILTANNTYSGTTTVKNGTLEIATGGSINGTSDIFIGTSSGDNGTLHLDGGSVSNAVGYLGNDAGSVGTASVSAGSWTNNGSLVIGNSGTGSLTISGGNVSNTVGNVASSFGSSGTVNVSGGTWTNSSALTIGYDGTGSLTINGTGTVTNAIGNIGFGSGGSGTVNVSGGTWANSSYLYIGALNGSRGSLTLNSGNVTNTDGYVGDGASSNGTASVSGGTWVNSGELTIGRNGAGSLTISGGNVTNTSGNIGLNAGSTGTVDVSGGTWANSSNLAVGVSGTGSLAINGTGRVIVGDTLSRGSSGTINLASGGTLQIGTGGDTGTLATDLTNDGTLLFDRSTESTYSSVISGTGTVIKNGTGTLILSGSNTYTGNTSVNAGTLEVDGSLANTATTVNSGGTLAGIGSLGDVTINSGGAIAPGNSPGTITVGNSVWNGGGIYNWQLGNATGTAGTGWDLITSNGSLAIGANATNKFVINASALDGAAFQSSADSYKWQIANFSGNITGFSTDKFEINPIGFGNTTNVGVYSVSANATAIALNYRTLFVWDAGNGTWSTDTNWLDNALPVEGAPIEFAGLGGNSTNNYLASISGLTFTANATQSYTLAGGNLSIGAGGIINNSSHTQTIGLNIALGANQTFAANTANLVVSGNISGTASVTKDGSQSLVLAGANSYTGGTTVNAGALVVEGAVGYVSNNATFIVQAGGVAGSVSNLAPATGTNNGTVSSLANAGTFTNSGNITGNATTSGTLTSTGSIAGTLEVNGGTTTIGFGGQVVGTSTITSGTLDVSGTVAGVTNNATLTVQQTGIAGSVNNSLSGSGTNNGTVAALANAGTFTNSGNITGNATTSGTLTSTGSIAGTLEVNGGTTTIGFGGQVSGTSTITSGTLDVSGTVAGVTNNATLTVQQTGIAGSVNNSLSGSGTNNGTVAALANAGTFTNSGNITGNATTSGTLTSTGSIAGTLEVNGGTTTIGFGGQVSGTSTITSGTLDVSGTVAGVTNNATLTVQQTGIAGSVNNSLSGSGTNNGTVAALANAGTFTNSGNITGNATTSGTLTSTGSIAGTLGVNGGTTTIGAGGQVSGASTVNFGSMVVSGTVAGVTNNASFAVQSGGAAGSVNNLLGASGTNNGTASSLANAGTFTNSGNIAGSVTTNGTLSSSGSIGGALTIGAGEATISGTVAGPTTISAGLLQGTGTLGAVTLNSGGTIAPGNGNGTATLNVGNSVWNGGGNYNWQVGNATGTAGMGWDYIHSTGSLSLAGTADNQFKINLWSLSGTNPDVNGTAQNFDPRTKYNWDIASFESISGFDKSKFSIAANPENGTGGFQGLIRGRFFMSSDGKKLTLNFNPASVWNSGTGIWSTAGQWEASILPSNDDSVEFTGSGGTSTNDGYITTISGLTFMEQSGAYTLNGTALTIESDGVVNNSNFAQTIALDINLGANQPFASNTANLLVSGAINGTAALTKMGNKTLMLTGNNTYSGGTTVTEGTLAGTTQGLKGSIVNNAVVNFDQSFNGTYAGVMSGTGSLAKTGSGVVLLSGNNTYSGGTTINSGTLKAALSGNLVTLNPNAFGTGGVNINAGGAMLVPSTTPDGSHLSIGGDLTLNNGTIAFYDIGTSPAGQDLRIDVSGNFTNAGSGAVFDFSQVEALDAGNYTLVSYNGTNFATSAISSRAGVGTTLQGSFSMNGSSLVYTVLGAQSSGTDIQNNGGPNTPIVSNYTINQTGVVTIGANNTVEALTFNSDGSLNIQQDGVLNVTSGTLNVEDGSSVVSGGTLLAPNGFNKDGGGELDFTNNMVVTGAAAVSEGLFSVNGNLTFSGGSGNITVGGNGTLGGNGSIAGNVLFEGNVLFAGGNLAPGNSPGNLTIGGNLVLTGANSTIIEIASPTNFDRITVTGQATLAGNMSVVQFGGYQLAYGQRYDILTAVGGITGEFANINMPVEFENSRGRFLISGTTGTLLIAPLSYVPLALNQNQRNVAAALDTFIAATSGDQQTVSIALDSLTTGEYPSAFNQIMPGFYESLASVSIEQAFNQTQMLNQRIGSVRLGASGFQAMGGITQPLLYDKDGKSAAEAKDANPIVESAMATNWNTWALGNGQFSRTTNLSNLQNSSTEAGGFLVGADYRWSENFVSGLYGGYEYTYSKYGSDSNMRGNGVNFGGYASYATEEGYYADAVIGGGYTGYQTRRSIKFSTIDRTAKADPNSTHFSAALNLGKDFEVGKFTLGPIVGAQYTYAGIGSFTESGADSLDLSLDQQNANSLRSTLGGRIAYTWDLSQKIAIIPEVRMFWQHEFMNNARNINASLDGGNGAAFDFKTTDPYRDSVFAGAGVTAQFGKNLSGSVFYNVNFGSQTYQSGMVSVGLNVAF